MCLGSAIGEAGGWWDDSLDRGDVLSIKAGDS